MEKYVIVAFNPDGTANFLEWSNDLEALKKIVDEAQKNERKIWIEEGGETHILEVVY